MVMIESMQQRFECIDQFLISTQCYWRFQPFLVCSQLSYPWQDKNPALTEWVEGLSYAEIERYKIDPVALDAHIADVIEGLDLAHQAVVLESHDFVPLDLNDRLYAGIPGRKTQQIAHLSHFLLSHHHGNSWLEWCAGKGYLGRVLANQSQLPVISLEFQALLCGAGQQFADRHHLPMTFIPIDVFSAQVDHYLHSDQHAIALHACGDLHRQLIVSAVDKRLKAITFSPCCYHLISGNDYQPLSIDVQQSRLSLTKNDLRIPLQETVTGGERVRRHRQQEMIYRLGFDALLRDGGVVSEYCPVPSIKKSQLADGFQSFCQWAACQIQKPLPACDYSYFEQVGTNRFWQMERISLVQQPFKRLLEYWIVLDKVLFLESSGYQVSMRQFCSRDDTPRNIMVHAVIAESECR
jgi:hypothetical protein